MSRTGLVIGAVVVAAAAVVLVLLLGTGDGDTSSGETAGPTERAMPPPVDRSVTVTDRPRIAGEAPVLAQASGEHPREYAVGDVRVRDHRSGDNAPLDIPPNVHPAEGRMLPSTLTHAISQKVKTVVDDCVKAVPAAARGTKPRVEGQLMVAIRDKQLTVTQSIMQLREVVGDVADSTKQCIEKASVGLVTEAGEEADLDRYSIRVSYAIR